MRCLGSPIIDSGECMRNCQSGAVGCGPSFGTDDSKSSSEDHEVSHSSVLVILARMKKSFHWMRGEKDISMFLFGSDRGHISTVDQRRRDVGERRHRHEQSGSHTWMRHGRWIEGPWDLEWPAIIEIWAYGIFIGYEMLRWYGGCSSSYQMPRRITSSLRSTKAKFGLEPFCQDMGSQHPEQWNATCPRWEMDGMDPEVVNVIIRWMEASWTHSGPIATIFHAISPIVGWIFRKSSGTFCKGLSLLPIMFPYSFLEPAF